MIAIVNMTVSRSKHDFTSCEIDRSESWVKTSLTTPGTNKKLQTAGGKRTLIQVAQCDQGSLFSRILNILGAFATMYLQYRALNNY